ncbi:hypothetical protein SAMN05192540_3846 [Maribacter dokdonensis]|uniref:Uncharacterized protein n=1 Tax=Maribacter dokdonensis TaxID=320912 RepID=A0A1H4UMY5_9FLAO|nr:hypothetical protein SAMN05192540_3846 [Maribacter dokdonensis]
MIILSSIVQLEMTIYVFKTAVHNYICVVRKQLFQYDYNFSMSLLTQHLPGFEYLFLLISFEN